MPVAENMARVLTDLLLPVMRYRLETEGVEGAGAYNYYQARVGSGRVFTEHEIGLAESIAKALPGLDEIHDIGCGWGQVVFLLAWCGFKTVGFEIDERRYLGAEHLRRVLDAIDPKRTDCATLRNVYFPPLDRPTGQRTMVIASNIIVGNASLVEEQIIWGLQRYDYAVIDARRFCRLRSPEEVPELIATVERVGLSSAGLLYDAGQDGSFHLFERRGGRG